jgi:hypothetical protein
VSGIGESLLKILFYTDLKMVLLKIETAEKKYRVWAKKRISRVAFSISNAKTH